MWLVLQGANPSRFRTGMLWFSVLKWHNVRRGSVLLESKHNSSCSPHFFFCVLLVACSSKSLFSALLFRKLGFPAEPSQHLIIFIWSFSGLPSGLHRALASLIDGTNTLLFSSERPFSICCHCYDSPLIRNFWNLKQTEPSTLGLYQTEIWATQGLQSRLNSNITEKLREIYFFIRV